MSETATSAYHTEHALLVLLGQYAQHLGLINALMAVPLHQQARTFSPQTKVLEFLVAILAGLPHLEDISRDGRPLDQDQAVAQAWQQAGWADYSGVARTLQGLTQAEAEAIAQVLDEISRPLLDQQVTQALAERDRLAYDGDLTGRPVSNTSKTYPGACLRTHGRRGAFGLPGCGGEFRQSNVPPALAFGQAASGQSALVPDTGRPDPSG